MNCNEKPIWGLEALESRRADIKARQAHIAQQRNRWIDNNSYFYEEVLRLMRFLIQPGSSVLNLRCQTGFMLDAVQPSRGLGLELSEEMVSIAQKKFPRHEYRVACPESFEVDEKFDYILFDSISETVDVLKALEQIHRCANASSRLIIYTYNHIWQPIISLAEKTGLKMPLVEQNWLSERDISNMLTLANFEALKTYRIVLVPKYIPALSSLFNRFIARLPYIDNLCMMQVIVARPAPVSNQVDKLGVSIIVPCKNEVGNIEATVKRIPKIASTTEIIFCDDRSTDGTAEKVKELQKAHPEKNIKLVEGPGICKSKNVWTGFDAATQEILMILDADLTVMPEELPYFFKAIAEGRGELINGVRMVYPVPKYAMKTFNMLGNKAFSILFSYILRQQIKDTLCGTKVIWRNDWHRIKQHIGSWGIEDHWGDYELLFGAAKLHLKIIDLPVHYQERVFGQTKMTRVFRNGLRMMRMFFAAFAKLRLGY